MQFCGGSLKTQKSYEKNVEIVEKGDLAAENHLSLGQLMLKMTVISQFIPTDCASFIKYFKKSF